MKHELRAEGVVEHIRAEAAGIQRAGDEFPKRVEVAVLRLRRVVVVRGAVMYVGGDPHHVADSFALDGGQQTRDFQLAAAGRSIHVRWAFEAVLARRILAVADDEAQRHVG